MRLRYSVCAIWMLVSGEHLPYHSEAQKAASRVRTIRVTQHHQRHNFVQLRFQHSRGGIACRPRHTSAQRSLTDRSISLPIYVATVCIGNECVCARNFGKHCHVGRPARAVAACNYRRWRPCSTRLDAGCGSAHLPGAGRSVSVATSVRPSSRIT
ncbi:hypothetical protein BD413DRAFT_163969 [Trametes elegans]|nr:hypothetical protein BD413DRAFT_163969 [Trametes elegans]